MRTVTYGDIRQKVERDLGMEDELFVSPTEMLGYCNEAIDEAEAEIHALCEDYFLSNAPLALVQGQAAYSLPADIYANKIRGLIYRQGVVEFEIPRIREWHKFEKFTKSNIYPTGPYNYSYLIVNTSASGPQILLTPPAKETSSSNVTIWFLRHAAHMVDDSTVCDIPEFSQFVIQYMKVRCYEKEGHPNLTMAMQALEHERQMMTSTLGNMVPDNNNRIEQDMSFYDELS